MGPLDGAPGVVLRDPELGLLRGMPSDGGRIEQNACALQRRNARTFRIPLVPANQRAEPSGGGIEGFESEVARREIKFFLVKRVVGDMHFAVDAAQNAVRIEDRCRVVIDAGGALFEE